MLKVLCGINRQGMCSDDDGKPIKKRGLFQMDERRKA